MRPLSMADIRKGYDRLRRRYFLDLLEGSPLHVPPMAKDLEWEWLPDNSDCMAETIFEDGVPVRMRLRRKYADRWTLLKPTLLHELTHIRLGPKYSCGGWSHAWRGPRILKSSPWHAETLRLVELGALQL